MKTKKPYYSIIIPIYNNQQFIASLVDDLNKLAQKLSKRGEVIFVIDASPDNSCEILKKLTPSFKFQSKIIVLAKNVGSFLAIKAGLDLCAGTFIAIKSADRQEPIALLQSFFNHLAKGSADIVVGVRQSRQDSISNKTASYIFWNLYRRFIDPSIPSGGVDMFACSAKVVPYLQRMQETHSSLIEYLFWLGFKRIEVPYERLKRESGKGSWSINKKINYTLDSIFAFSNFPILLFFVLGSISLILALSLSLIILIARLKGTISLPGYSASAIISLFFFGLNTIELSIICNYIWRTYENTKQRPQYIIQEKYERRT